MDAELHRLVRDRSGGRCEYCRLPEAESLVAFEIEHIIPRKHRGRTVAGNLAWACIYCNGYKGPNLSGRDPATGKITGSTIRDGTNGAIISATKAAR